MTASGTLAQTGRPSAWNRPQPRASASRARPTAVVGNTRRTRTVSRTTTPMLLGQRVPRPSFCSRRGASISQRPSPRRRRQRRPGGLRLASEDIGIAQSLPFDHASAAGDIAAPPLVFFAIDLAAGVALIEDVAGRAHPPAGHRCCRRSSAPVPRSRQSAAPAGRS